MRLDGGSLLQLPFNVQLKGGEEMPSSGKRGFGSMDEMKQRQIASKGGQAAHAKGSGHEFSPEEARQAGSKGGKAAHEKGPAHGCASEDARGAGRTRGEAASQDRHGRAVVCR